MFSTGPRKKQRLNCLCLTFPCSNLRLQSAQAAVSQTALYSSCLNRGSRMSLSQSPNRFREITVSSMAKPGIVEIHQASAKKSLPSDTMEPQAGVGGGTPAPRKLKVASTSITMLTCRVPTTIRVLMTPGKMCVMRMRGVDAPASTG